MVAVGREGFSSFSARKLLIRGELLRARNTGNSANRKNGWELCEKAEVAMWMKSMIPWAVRWRHRTMRCIPGSGRW